MSYIPCPYIRKVLYDQHKIFGKYGNREKNTFPQSEVSQSFVVFFIVLKYCRNTLEIGKHKALESHINEVISSD